MQTHTKKRLEIIIEAPILRRVLNRLDDLDVTGYTVLPALAGRGRDGTWSRSGQIADAGRMVAVICITDPERAEEVLEAVYKIVSRQIGIVTLSDVQVVRPERF